MTKAAYQAKPPFQKPKIKKKAEQRFAEKAAAKNAEATAQAVCFTDRSASAAVPRPVYLRLLTMCICRLRQAAKQALIDQKAAKEADKRKSVGAFIAKNGNGALLGASPSFLSPCRQPTPRSSPDACLDTDCNVVVCRRLLGLTATCTILVCFVDTRFSLACSSRSRPSSSQNYVRCFHRYVSRRSRRRSASSSSSPTRVPGPPRL
eukprot:COSAG06_NODE_3914_length_4778_cov_1.301560_3_plen_206_part_00